MDLYAFGLEVFFAAAGVFRFRRTAAVLFSLTCDKFGEVLQAAAAAVVSFHGTTNLPRFLFACSKLAEVLRLPWTLSSFISFSSNGAPAFVPPVVSLVRSSLVLQEFLFR